jgi:transcriptional regulator with XRE-family HTH domain
MKNSRSTPPRNPNWIDQHLADQMRSRRRAIEMTQDHLARQLGVTFQQIQKYEKGINRISAARLYQICRVLDVPIASMFEDIPRSAPTPKKNDSTASRSKKKPPG